MQTSSQLDGEALTDALNLLRDHTVDRVVHSGAALHRFRCLGEEHLRTVPERMGSPVGDRGFTPDPPPFPRRSSRGQPARATPGRSTVAKITSTAASSSSHGHSGALTHAGAAPSTGAPPIALTVVMRKKPAKKG
ncbi:hypothetical protein ENSA5_28110 [Enhygromyxa salina]|uniref:Uncharacterized protein n=1 Tax=Enhygromyxa salina TaxID=215803 RepID=A0A2S9Y4H5_9BACT|nr:hypothetical protein ENSA5_28110 [Enhygromyxa salina]